MVDYLLTNVTYPLLRNIYYEWMAPSASKIATLRQTNQHEQQRIAMYSKLETVLATQSPELPNDVLFLLSSYLGEQEHAHCRHQFYRTKNSTSCPLCEPPRLTTMDWITQGLSEGLVLFVGLVLFALVLYITWKVLVPC